VCQGKPTAEKGEGWEEKLDKIWERGHVPEWANDVLSGIKRIVRSLLSTEKRKAAEEGARDLAAEVLSYYCTKSLTAEDSQATTVEEVLKVIDDYLANVYPARNAADSVGKG
jgi:hypothetical protein